MELITTFKQVNCPVLKYGLKKIKMDYYFCKNCDKEQKFPICHGCLIKCHKGHQGTEKIAGTDDNLIRCSCAMNNHQTSTEEGNYSVNTCFFYELNKVTDSCFCYQNTNNKRICNFCYCFCKPNSNDEKEFQLEFKKIQIDNNNFKCKCPNFKHSKHTAVDVMSKNLSDINKSTENYFPNSNPVILTNLYFGSNELFRSVNKKFLGVFNQLILEHGDRYNNMDITLKKNVEELYIRIPSIIMHTYFIFRNNAYNCSKERILYFVKEVNIYFNEKVFKFFIGNCRIGIKGALSNYKLEENFYEHFLFGFKIFHVNAQFFNASLPKYKITEFISLTPFQRMLIQNKNRYLYHYDYENILEIAEEFNKTNQTFLSCKIVIQIFSIIKMFASVYIFNKEQINEFTRTLSTYFENLEVLWSEIHEKDNILKLLHIISKILIYFSYYYNDFCIMTNSYNIYDKYFNNNEKNNSNNSESKEISDELSNSFIYKDHEITRNVSKCIVHLTRVLHSEYSNYSKLNAKSKKYLLLILDKIHILLRLNFLKNDFYDFGLKIFLSDINEEYIKYVFYDILPEDKTKIINYLLNEQQEINFKMNEYYTSSKDISIIINKYSKSLNNVLNIFGNNKTHGNVRKASSIDSSKITQVIQNPVNIIDEDEKEKKEKIDEKENKKEPNNAIDKNKTNNKNVENTEKNNNNNEYYKLMSLVNYFQSLTNIFNITKDKKVFNDDFCEDLLFLFSRCVESSSATFYIYVNKQIIINLNHMPYEYQPKILSIIKRGLKILINERNEIGYHVSLMDTLNDIYLKNTNVLVKNEVIYYKCLAKILSIYLLISLTKSPKSEILRFMKNNLMNNHEIKNIIDKYMKYLLSIGSDFIKNKQYYLAHKTFFHKDIYKTYFNEKIEHKIIYKIFITYVKIIIYNFQGVPYISKLQTLRENFPPKNLETILQTTTLNIKLRSILIQLCLILYFSPVIDEKKLNIYRTQFQLNLDDTLQNSRLSTDQSRFLNFYYLLLNVNIPSLIEEEYNILIYEIKNFHEILNYSNIKTKNELKNYYEYDILLPLIVYLNKVFSYITTYNGKELLGVYSLTYNMLLSIRLYNNKMMMINSQNGNDPLNSILQSKEDKEIETDKNNIIVDNEKNHKEKVDEKIDYHKPSMAVMNKINKYLNRLTSHNNSPIDYASFYQIYTETISNYFQPKIQNKIYLINNKVINKKSDHSNEKNEENKIKTNNSFNEKIKVIYDMYENEKEVYNNLGFKNILDLNYCSNENTFRIVFVEYLLNLIVEDISVYDDESNEILLKLLTNETGNTQNSIMSLYNRRIFKKLNVLIEKCFTSMLISLISIYNPSLILYNDNFLNSYSSLNLFKLLCVGNNVFFQKIFLKQFYFSLNDIQKIGFYDLMLYFLEKIIIISGWNRVKEPEDFNDNYAYLFESITIMLIEIIQGTEDSNFYSLINQKFEGGQKRFNANRMDPVLKKGKAFESFLKCVRNLITHDDTNSIEFNRIRKILMDFFLAFMEEYHCPIEIKLMIIINFHASQFIKSISKILKNIYKEDNPKKSSDYLNAEIEEYFRKLYFIDENLGKDPSFQLCCSFYNYFKITLLECKDTEAYSFWYKIGSITEDSLVSYNLSTHNKTLKSDASDFEAYYVIKLFENISKSVLVKIKEDKSPIFVVYTKPPCLNYLSEQTKNNFLNVVNRSSRNTKLIELMEQSEYFRIEVEYNFHKLRNRELMKKLCWMDYYGFKLAIFVIDVILNIYMLSVAHSNGEIYTKDYHYTIIRTLSLICCIVVFILFLTWLLTKMELNSELEKVKYMEQHGIKDEKNMTKKDKFKLFFRAYFAKGELNSLFYFFIFRILGSINESFAFCYSFSLIAVMTLSGTLSNLTQSLVLKGRQLIWVTIFTIVVVYIYSGWGFYYLNNRFYDATDREEPENMCYSLLYCFFTLINNGLRWYPGVGKVLRTDSPFLHLGAYIHNYIYHFTFYLIIRVMMLKIVFGIILDSFTELREIKANIERDRNFKCFICNIGKDECEKKNKDFNEHCKKDHNLWDYANYMIMLRMTDFQDLNGVNSMCKEMILERQMKWLPDNEIIND